MKSVIFYTSLTLLFLAGCTSKIVFDEPVPVVATPNSDLLISEITTAINTDGGTFRNHYVELFNGTASAVDLTDYAVGYFATKDTFTLSDFNFTLSNSFITLNKKLDTNKCYVIASPICDNTKLKGDTTWGTTSNTAANASNPLQLSGNSAIALLKKDATGAYNLSGNKYKIIDVFGSPLVARVNSQGTSSSRNNIMWAVAGETRDTRNRTFFRKSSVKNPTIDWNVSRGTDAINSQWIITNDRVWDYTNVGLPTQ
ncbi:MAG: lamin tail domain-containing protein [Chitinophagaceae bacterium]